MKRLLVLLASAVLVTACSSRGPDVGEPVETTTTTTPALGPLGIDVASQELIELKAQSGMLDCPASPSPDPEEPTLAPASPLPAVTLPCLGGGRDVRLSQLDGPLLLNLWASYCEPCRVELPVLQQVHELGADQLTVLGIDYEDQKPFAALQLAADSGVTFASVADLDAVTASELRVVGLPQTVFVDASGGVVGSHHGPIRSYQQASALVLEHLGIRLPEPPDDGES